MADKEKVLPDPIEIGGIRIGDDRFKIQANLDLNRIGNKGFGSIARSPQKTYMDNNKEEYSSEAIATGLGSIAFGPQAASIGDYSFSVGKASYARGEGSFCHAYKDEFNNNFPNGFEITHGTAYGDGSACFCNSSAWGTLSFSEGGGLVSVQDKSTKEGRDQSKYAHAEGLGTASGPCTHAEGLGIASDSCAHAEGGYFDKYLGIVETTHASGIGAHAEGSKTQATGAASHAEGYSTTAFGYYCHSGGGWTRAGDIEKPWNKSVCCTAIGEFSISTGNCSFSGGYASRTKGKNSFSFGGATVAQEDEQFVIGRANIPKSNCCFIIGGGSKHPDSKVWNPPENSRNITKNILEIDWDGNLWINGIFSYGENKIPIDLDKYYTKDESDNKFLTQETSNNRLLPSVTAADNGKILSVVNGAWATTTIINAEGVAY